MLITLPEQLHPNNDVIASRCENAQAVLPIKVEFNSDCCYRCLLCHACMPISSDFRCSHCGGFVECFYPKTPFTIKQTCSDNWRFADVLPILPYPLFTCETTASQRIDDSLLMDYQIYGKIDGTLPSGSIKYRQCAMAVSSLIALGVSEIVLYSSGNTGSSFMYWAEKCMGALNVHVFASEHHAAHRLRYKGEHSTVHLLVSDLVGAEETAQRYATEKGFLVMI